MVCFAMTESTKPPRKSGWSDARRAKHAALMRRWQPWTKSTGPKTAEGKARSAQNSYKHGNRTIERRRFRSMIAAQKRLHTLAISHVRTMKRLGRSNELLEDTGFMALHRAAIAHGAQLHPYYMTEVMQKPCIFGSPEGKS